MLIGRTDLGPKEVRSFMEKLSQDYPGNSYHLITKNCNHFCNDVCTKLTGKAIPRWVNRLARLGRILLYFTLILENSLFCLNFVLHVRKLITISSQKLRS